MSRGKGGRAPSPARRISPRTPEDKAARLIERDLATRTGAEILAIYGSGAPRAAFEAIVGTSVEDVAAAHNPFWHYALAVWFDNPEGRAMMCDPHRLLADDLLAFATGEFDEYDGYHCEYPRRGLKSTFLEAFADWLPKRHKLVDGIDISILYSHNSHREAKNRVGIIKQKARAHPYIARYFDDFQVPAGEWGTQEEWSVKCRSETSSVAEATYTAMSAAAKKAGRGYNYKLLDDWEDEESRSSEEIRETLSQSYDQLRALKAFPFSREAVIGTPYHIHGLYRPMRDATHSDGKSRYKVRIVPSLDDNDKPNFPNVPSLTVAGLAKERANEIQRTGSDIFWYLQYQLDPRLTGTQTMEWEWMRSVTPLEYKSRYHAIPHFTAIFCDPAWKGMENQGEGDFTAIGAIGIWHRGEQREHGLLDLVVSNEMTADEGAREMCRLMRKWHTPFYYCEQRGGKGFDPLIRMVARQQYLYPVPLDLKGWPQIAKKGKENSRISYLAGSARMGYFFYLSTINHQKQFEVQVRDHPQSMHDDILDMISNAYAEAVLDQFVPVSGDIIAQRDWAGDPIGSNANQFVAATRYTNVPAIH